RADGSRFATVDTPSFDRMRPLFWGANSDPPALEFASLARDPLPAARQLAKAHADWGSAFWGNDTLLERAKSEGWGDEMIRAAEAAAADFNEEQRRIATGVELLSHDARLGHAFKLMNESMTIVGVRKGYSAWRPFQLGFLLANIASIVDKSEEPNVVDIVWFATGGGKTETYLGLLMTAAFY